MCLMASILALTNSCESALKAGGGREVVPDEKFLALFSPDSGGVTGADGIFSVVLSDSQSIFLMGDSFLGKVVNEKRDIKTKLLRNSFILITENEEKARAIYRGTYDNPYSMMEPEQDGGTARWYWPGHGFVEDSVLYVFALNMYNDPALIVKSDKDESEKDEVDRMTESMWAFQVYGIDLLSFKLPGFEQISSDRVTYGYETGIHFGNSIYTEGKYIYVMGTRDYQLSSKIHVARTEFGKQPYFTNWEFYNGSEWVPDYMESASMDIDISVPEQFSVFKIEEKYVLLAQERGTGDIYTYTSASPHTGYGNKQFIYRTPEIENEANGLFTYNAMAHPQYIENDMLLVSYCVNGPVREIYNDVNNYRGRFIRVPLSMIDPAFITE